MKKILTLTLVVLALICLLASCGKTPENTTTMPTTTQPTVTEPQVHEHVEEIIPAVESTCTEAGLTEGKKCSVCGEILVAQAEAPLKAHTEEIIPAVESTCTQAGLTEGKQCTFCGEILVAQQEAPLRTHDPDIIPEVESTCTETGLTEGKKCHDCGEILVAQNVVPLKEHTYDDKTDLNCNDCGYERACDHASTKVLASVGATCTSTGLTEGKQCTVCDEILVAQTVVPLKAHTEVVDARVEPTCTSTGLTEGKHCSVCGTVMVSQEQIGMIEHDYATVTVTAPTCTEKGYTKHTCVCGVFYNDTYVEATGHIFGDWVTVKEPTKTEEGLKERTCVCGLKETSTIPTVEGSQGLSYELNEDGLGYTVIGLGSCTDKDIEIPATYNGLPVTTLGTFEWYKWVNTTVTSVKIPASITMIVPRFLTYSSAVTEYIVDENNPIYKTIDGNIYTKDGKTLIAYAVGKAEANFNVPDGVESLGFYAITETNYLVSITVPVSVTYMGGFTIETCPKFESVYYAGTIEQWKNVDSTQIGGFSTIYYTVYCIDGEIAKDGTVTYYKTASQGLEYTLNSDGQSYSVTGIGTCTDTDIVIPDTYNGLPVTKIGNSAFKNNKSLTSINIPNSITSISSSAFRDCTSLISVEVDENNLSYESIDGNLYTKNGYHLILYATGKKATSFDIPNFVKYVDENAFSYCASLTNITIPNSVVTIGDSAFSRCTSLTNIIIPNSVTRIGRNTFDRCESLASITIPNTVTSIEEWAFNVCSSLKDVYYTGNVEDWLKISFQYHTSSPMIYGANLYFEGELVTDIVIPNSVRSVGNYAFYRCYSLRSIEIPDSVMSIGAYAFYDCASLTNINIPDSVTSIGSYAFQGCSSLTSINIPDYVTSIGSYAFQGCSSLTSIEIPDSVTSIGDSIFRNCSSLTSINIPDSVTSIGNSAFLGCKSLIEVCNKSILNITVASNDNGYVGYYAKHIITDESKSAIKHVGDYIFYDDGTDVYFVKYIGDETEITLPEYDGDKEYGIWKYVFENFTSLKSIKFPDFVTSIGDYAFFGCTSLISVMNSKSITSIGNYTFYGCTSLTSVTIGNSVTSIGYSAFYKCTSLTSIIIPDSVTSIGNDAFYWCTSLTIYCEAESKPEGWDSDWTHRPVVWGYKPE